MAARLSCHPPSLADLYDPKIRNNIRGAADVVEREFPLVFRRQLRRLTCVLRYLRTAHPNVPHGADQFAARLPALPRLPAVPFRNRWNSASVVTGAKLARTPVPRLDDAQASPTPT